MVSGNHLLARFAKDLANKNVNSPRLIPLVYLFDTFNPTSKS